MPPWLRRTLVSFALLFVAGALVLAGLIMFGSQPAPPPMASVSQPFEKADRADLPEKRTLEARDGTALAYRHYRGDGQAAVLALHGSSADGRSLHSLARALSQAGASVWVPDLRGHGDSGRPGDVDHISQLEEDVADFLRHIRESQPEAPVTLLGFSSGGGLALRHAGRSDAEPIDQLVLLSPMLGIESAPYREENPHADATDWARPFVPRIIALTLLNRLGIHTLDHLPVIAFAVDPDASWATPTYSHRLLASINPQDHRALLKDVEAPVTLLAGARDQVFTAEAYAPAVQEVRPEAEVRLIPGVDHVGMTLDLEALQAVTSAMSGTQSGR